ncbi:hypothetical protein BCUN_1809 [Bifidobacterium cuniculi]|uniref:Uncharacterized protein n=1 Tax=Bifidobacterium cuniculi TaxID=1688 RepID=A0A087AT68_9BIFI|nr:hypothetical protein BCUN_1809 [Bifidobacterium cuniculi]
MLSVRIIPAYAGQLCAERSRVGAFSDHPRIRGATGLRHGTTPCSSGSSPHTRGNCGRQGIRRLQIRIIPAYAGQLARPLMSLETVPDHPRIRGATAAFEEGAERWRGSSPHTRGNCRAVSSPLACRRIIPAYAGQLAGMSSVIGYLPDHPRIRGATRAAPLPLETRVGSSPHTRGNCRPPPPHARNNRIIPHTRGNYTGGARRVANRRIIPAYAGQLPPSRTREFRRPDHPRIRGATTPWTLPRSMTRGSSPHTRGNWAACGSCAAGSRIIPAYAGQLHIEIHPRRRRADHPRIRGATHESLQ